MSGVLCIPPSAPSRAEATAKAEENKAAGRSPPDTGSGENAPARSPAKLANDAACRAIRASHRFDSFAPERSENMAKWCVFTSWLLIESELGFY